ncbi:hypothetical protein EI555_001171, partial [Monodon monoceros]
MPGQVQLSYRGQHSALAAALGTRTGQCQAAGQTYVEDLACGKAREKLTGKAIHIVEFPWVSPPIVPHPWKAATVTIATRTGLGDRIPDKTRMGKSCRWPDAVRTLVHLIRGASRAAPGRGHRVKRQGRATSSASAARTDPDPTFCMWSPFSAVAAAVASCVPGVEKTKPENQQEKALKLKSCPILSILQTPTSPNPQANSPRSPATKSSIWRIRRPETQTDMAPILDLKQDGEEGR